MPRYHFNIRVGDRTITDPNGRDLPGLKAAHWTALGLARDASPHFPDMEGWLIDIADEAGRVLETFVPTFMRCR